MKPTRLVFALSILLVCSCKKDGTPSPAEQLRNVWIASIVKEGSATVFTKGATTNVKPGYSQFRLDLSSATAVRLTELDGTTFVGVWDLSADEKTLTLRNLNPQPTSTGGTVAYTIGTISETDLVLARTTANPKTGGTANAYTLTK